MKHKITVKGLAVLMSIVTTGSMMVAIPAVAEDKIISQSGICLYAGSADILEIHGEG